MRTITLILLFLPTLLFAQLRGKVVAVSDGDTFTLLTKDSAQVKVRLHGIDCPEKKQDFGSRAKQFTSDLVFGKTVELQVTDTDRYQRVVGIVMLKDGRVLNEELLKAGLAWHYKKYDNSQKWSALEVDAREHKFGVWSVSDSISPEQYRRMKKAKLTGHQRQVR